MRCVTIVSKCLVQKHLDRVNEWKLFAGCSGLRQTRGCSCFKFTFDETVYSWHLQRVIVLKLTLTTVSPV